MGRWHQYLIPRLLSMQGWVDGPTATRLVLTAQSPALPLTWRVVLSRSPSPFCHLSTGKGGEWGGHAEVENPLWQDFPYSAPSWLCQAWLVGLDVRVPWRDVLGVKADIWDESWLYRTMCITLGDPRVAHPGSTGLNDFPCHLAC